MSTLHLSLCFFLLLSVALFAGEQGRFSADMGNTGQYVDTILKPPLKLKWRYFTGGGFKGSPVGFNGRLFCLDRWGRAYALDGESGRLLWRKSFPSVYNASTREAPIPLAYGVNLYLFGNNGSLHCVRQNNGEAVWEFPNIGTNPIMWGRGSPVACQGKVYVGTRTLNTIFRVACFDTLNGRLVWSKEYACVDGIGHGEIAISTLTAPASIIGTFNGGSLNWCPKTGRIFALTADSGRVLWEDSAYFSKRITIYDTLVYASSCSAGTYGNGALDVRTGKIVMVGPSYNNIGPTAMDDRYIYIKKYCQEPEFFEHKNWVRVGGCDWSSLASAPGWETGCGSIALANGYGYFGLGGGGAGGTAEGGRGRGRLGQGVYAFEIPKDTMVKKLKIVWGFKTASNFCSTPVIMNGKLYVTTNQEGVVYCFENQ